MKRFAGLSALAALLLLGGGSAYAETKPIKVGTALDFTKVYTFLTAEYSQGQRDYIAYLNGRGGIKGTPVELEVVDTGNEPQRGIEAYERFKNDGAVLMDFLSTPVSRAVVPRALEDGMNVITAFHGRSDAADGTVFPTIFPMTPAYWSQATAIVKYIADKEGGNLKGKKIVLVHIDSPFGKEPIPVFQALAEKLGYTFSEVGYPSPGNEQSAQWTQVRHDKPDWVVLWGAGGGQPNSLREALRNGISPDKIVSVIWLSETDMGIAGADQAKGVSRFEGVAFGKRPLIKAIEAEVIAKGKGAGDAQKGGQQLLQYRRCHHGLVRGRRAHCARQGRRAADAREAQEGPRKHQELHGRWADPAGDDHAGGPPGRRPGPDRNLGWHRVEAGHRLVLGPSRRCVGSGEENIG